MSVGRVGLGGEGCACDLIGPLGRSQPTVSHHLSVLTDAGLISREKRGRWAWYRVVPERLVEGEHLLPLPAQGVEELLPAAAARQGGRPAGRAFIDALKPKTWAWKSDGSKGVGFIAHEVQEVSPSSVVGEKDGEKMQVMEYGSAEFIANIIAELQSLRARVAQLEAK